MKNKLISILSTLLAIISRMILKMANNENAVIVPLVRSIEDNSTNYFCYKLRPKKADYYLSSKIQTTAKEGELAIVLQGLVETREDFTIETVKLYQKLFSKAIIIISTWDYTSADIIDQLKRLGCEIVLSKDIPVCGLGNINYQVCTTTAGLKKAKELGAKFALKSRSDLRIYREFAFEYLKSLVELNPVKKDNVYGLKGRIVSQAGNWGQMFNPMWLQDFLYFGYTDDLLNFFSTPFDNQTYHSCLDYYKKMGLPLTGATFAIYPCPEISLTKKFIQKYHDSNLSLKEWWNFIADYCYIVDSENLLTLWNKYGLNDLGKFYCEYNGRHNYADAYRHVSASDFINILNKQYVFEDWMENEKNNYIVS